MGSKERRERERQELRGRILDAARAICVKEGLEAVTMRRIAEEIEYSPTALYLHFADKESLLKELCANDLMTLHHAMLAVVETEPDVIGRLYAVARAFVKFGTQHRTHYQMVFMIPKPDGPGYDRDAEPQCVAYGAMRDCWAEIVASGRLRPECSDADLLAQVWFAGIHGIVSAYIVMGDSVMAQWRDPIEQATAFVDAILKGILK